MSTAKKIAAAVQDTLDRNTKMALEANTAFGGRGLTRGEIERLHESCSKNLGSVIAEMTAQTADQTKTFDQRAADALADEVDALVRRKTIDARSPAADALLDYRSPPSRPRSDLLAARDMEIDRLRRALATLDAALPHDHELKGKFAP